ncbi:MAG: twin-arginine translocase subunit TatC, partial [Candidatus Marinimicrobia bacterium]|nr:twin-arginine translocase subunit TatC [Candidatus Neomarinimicrobiota bacterium]
MPKVDEMSFLDHLEELRWRILKSMAAIIVIAIAAYTRADTIINFLTAPALRLETPVIMQALRVSDMFMVQLIVSLLTGLIVASPIVLYQIWRFIAPAMVRSSNLLTLAVVLSGSIFFIAGLSFGYKVLLPFSLRFFTSLGGELVQSN